MPIYEYHCESCGETFERMQKVSDPPLSGCPNCGEKVKRVISQTSFTLKGGGWYKDGYSSTDSSKRTSSGNGNSKQPSKDVKSTDKKDSSK